jgi:hypothetical protein
MGRVDGLVTSDEEVRKLMLEREAWRSRIKMTVAANKEVHSSRREDSKISRIKTTRAIVLIEYNFIELRNILSRVVVVVAVFCKIKCHATSCSTY